MELAAAGLREQPFRAHGTPVAMVPYNSSDEALLALRETCEKSTGLALLQGPPLSGKSTLLRHFAENLDEDRAYAIIDGTGLSTMGLLEAALRQFGYDVDFTSKKELLAMLRVFALQQATSCQAPILIIENTHQLNPNALGAVGELAEMRYRLTCAFNLVLSSDRSLDFLDDDPSMNPVMRRVCADIHMRPMSCDETKYYLRKKLSAAGSETPERVFPNSVCVELWEASGGWPGVLDRIALLALARAEKLPVTAASIERPALPDDTVDCSVAESESIVELAPAPPKLFVSKDGKTIRELSFEQPRLLVGRSEHNDIAIPSKFVSRHHLMLVRHSTSTFVMDLNSSNGTYVNSKRISNHVLVHDDVITIGHHRIKFVDPHAVSRVALNEAQFADTAVMKTLDDMRMLLDHENTVMLPIATENLPTYNKQ
jgi:type II secretory pathway predicted ATPase ExeA/pSer/pThr/pTyr-binding forkhead associated (FHA) protein